MLAKWNERPLEVAHLLNPAFCSITLRESVIGYMHQGGEPMPYPLSFVILPLVLHKATRDTFPRTIRTKFHSWIHQSQSVRLNFHTRVQQLVPYTKEALHWCFSTKMLALDGQGFLDLPNIKVAETHWPSSSEPEICKTKAYFLGRWLTHAGDSATIFAIMGIKP